LEFKHLQSSLLSSVLSAVKWQIRSLTGRQGVVNIHKYLYLDFASFIALLIGELLLYYQGTFELCSEFTC
jgi:hypothetical protein